MAQKSTIDNSKKAVIDNDKNDQKTTDTTKQLTGQSIIQKHPNKVPILVQKGESSKIKTLDSFKNKFIVSEELTIGGFMLELRKRTDLKTEDALFVFVNNVVPPTSAILKDIYAKHKDEDGFLRITFTEENTFGTSN